MALEWTKTEEYLIGKTQNFIFKKKLAMFDLDSTLITPKIGRFGHGKGFPLNSDDWKFLFDNVKNVLNDYEKDNYSIIIISNQGGIALGKQTIEQWIDKISKIQKSLGIDIYVFCSINQNKYRKPYPTWFNEFIPKDIQLNIDRKRSFYCGDACGRKGDFSDTDYKFALNCMIKFKTPENFFTGEITKIPKLKYFDMFNIYKSTDFDINNKFNFIPKKKEIILMIGYQGSGKSFISNLIKNKYGYTIINQDTLKSKEKCKKITKENMMLSNSIIIDKTNSNKIKRKEWITLANQYNYSVRAIIMTTSRELSKHNNYYRHLTTGTKIVPEIAYKIFNSEYEPPELSEGFTEIIKNHCSKPNNLNYHLILY